MGEPIEHVISKTSHWPAEKRREYLSLAYQTEKNYRRRAKIYTAMRDLTTNTLKKEIRHERS
jgi:hypothetical protein